MYGLGHSTTLKSDKKQELATKWFSSIPILFIHFISTSSSSSFETSPGYQCLWNFTATHFPISKVGPECRSEVSSVSTHRFKCLIAKEYSLSCNYLQAAEISALR